MLLGNEQYTHLTVHFLNAVLKPLIRIKSALIQNPISDKEYEDDKFSVFDVLATDENGWIYDIEIQRFLQTHLANRVTLLWLAQDRGSVERRAWIWRTSSGGRDMYLGCSDAAKEFTVHSAIWTAPDTRINDVDESKIIRPVRLK